MSVRVLIIDDEEGICKSLSAFLKLEGYCVEVAFNGEEGLRKIREDKYNVILLDINMPGMSGLETLQAIKAIDFSIQVIMMTAYSTFDKTMKSLEFGAADYILKPFDDLDSICNLVKIAEERLERWRRNMSASIIKQREED